LASRALTQVTRQFGIDTSPAWSADGNTLYFTSDRGGKPQVYQVPANGGSASRVTFQGSYNADPVVSFDGQKIATTLGHGYHYWIELLDHSLGSPCCSHHSHGPQDGYYTFAH